MTRNFGSTFFRVRYLESGCQVPVKMMLFNRWEEAGYGNHGLTPQDLLDQSWKVKFSDIITNLDVSAQSFVKIDGKKRSENLLKINQRGAKSFWCSIFFQKLVEK